MTRELITVSWILPGDMKLLGERQGQFITLRGNNVLLVGLHSSSKSLNLMRVTEVGFDI